MGHRIMPTDPITTIQKAVQATNPEQVQKALTEILNGIEQQPALFLRYGKVGVKGVYMFTPAMIAEVSNALFEKTGLRIKAGLDGAREVYLSIPEALKAQIKHAFECSYTGDIQNINTPQEGNDK